VKGNLEALSGCWGWARRWGLRQISRLFPFSPVEGWADVYALGVSGVLGLGACFSDCSKWNELSVGLGISGRFGWRRRFDVYVKC